MERTHSTSPPRKGSMPINMASKVFQEVMAHVVTDHDAPPSLHNRARDRHSFQMLPRARVDVKSHLEQPQIHSRSDPEPMGRLRSKSMIPYTSYSRTQLPPLDLQVCSTHIHTPAHTHTYSRTHSHTHLQLPPLDLQVIPML